jgi:hypothetical protein
VRNALESSAFLLFYLVDGPEPGRKCSIFNDQFSTLNDQQQSEWLNANAKHAEIRKELY